MPHQLLGDLHQHRLRDRKRTRERLPDNKTFNYSILFVSGVGLLTGGATGVVDIVPTGVGKGKNCVTKFTVVSVTDP